ncbi:LPS export ABC transporter periplasmic protein LptC [Prochlorococcus marinus]|uniref:LPS export ABC transporter periplasmic protein LptC n=1 Tax=Prochlorococcus marinus TaxID=1219 RepID=UPI0022B4AF31|nr:LPS export ABC transporter periplasmic protein LptC [Prochlorococcus marinus]
MIISRLYSALIITVVLLSGCSKSTTIKSNNNSSYDLKEFNVQQYNNNGKKEFELTSQSAYIEPNNQTAKANKTILIFYQDNIPSYKINSDKSTIINNGDNINFTGNVIFKSINNGDIDVRGRSIEWDKKKFNAIVKGNIVAIVNDSLIKSSEAIYNHKKDQIKFINIQEYSYKNRNTLINIISNHVIWDGSLNRLVFTSTTKPVITKIKLFN